MSKSVLFIDGENFLHKVEEVLKDDYGRIEVAINLNNFAKRYQIK